MHVVVDVVIPTLAVVASWLGIGLVLLGCGHLTRRALLALVGEGGAGGPVVADLWIGFGVLVAYLQIWSLFLRIGWFAWPLPLAAGVVGIAPALRRLRAVRPSGPALALSAVVGLGVLWLANRALGPIGDYDFGLYHDPTIQYALRYPALPGLANLHVRLGANDAHLLFVAFLDHGPWARLGPHLANGLICSLLLVTLGSRALRTKLTFTSRLAPMLALGAVAVVASRPTFRLSSPNLDLAAFVLVVVGSLFLAECVEGGFLAAPALACVTSFTVAAVTRPLYWVAAVVAAVVVVTAATRDAGQRRHLARAAVLAWLLPGVLLIGWLGREAVLTGYPLFPETLIRLPVDWRVPAAAVHQLTKVEDAWARLPGADPQTVLGSWGWLRGGWLWRTEHDLDVIAPFVLLAALPAFFAGGAAERRKRTKPMLALLAVALPTLLIWFFVAPDPRFVFAPMWLVPAALCAWALPANLPRPGVRLAAVGVVAGAGIATMMWLDVRWAFGVALACAGALALAVVLLGAGARRRLAAAAAVAVAVAVVGGVAQHGGFHPQVANKGGSLGTAPEPTPATVPFTTAWGLRVARPAEADQCYAAFLCTPYPNRALHLRSGTVRSGFSVR